MGGRGRVGDRYHASPRRAHTPEPFPTMGYATLTADVAVEHARVLCERDLEPG